MIWDLLFRLNVRSGSVANTMPSFAYCAPKSLSLERGNNCHSKSADHRTSQFIGGDSKMDWSMDWQGTETTDITTKNSITNYTATCSMQMRATVGTKGGSVCPWTYTVNSVSRKLSPCRTHISENILAPTWLTPWSIRPGPWTSLQMFPGCVF